MYCFTMTNYRSFFHFFDFATPCSIPTFCSEIINEVQFRLTKLGFCPIVISLRIVLSPLIYYAVLELVTLHGPIFYITDK